jgi:hypothetical protein
MSLEPHSSNAGDPALVATPITFEIEAVRSCVGKVYTFKPFAKKWNSETQHEFHLDRMYQCHPVVVIHRQPDGRVHIVNITSSVDETADPRIYMPVSGNHWQAGENCSEVRLVNTKEYACELPKPRSYVKLDSRRTVPFEALKEIHTPNGELCQLAWESAVKLWDCVIEAERGFISQQDWEYQNAEKKVSSAVSSYINRWTSVEQGQNQICKLQVLQERVKSLAAVVDECLNQHWLQPQRELQQSLSERGRTLQDALSRQLDYERDLVPGQSQDQANHSSLIEAAEEEAVRRLETEIVICEMTKDHNYETGKRASGQKKRIRRAVEKIINEELQRRHREKAWKAAESTLVEAGYSKDDLAFLECEWLAQVNSHQPW